MADNEPVGFSQLTERSFQAKEENDWLDRGDPEFTIETGQGGPEGDNSVGQAFYQTGFVAGSAPINTYYPISGREDNALFLHIRGFRVSSDWVGQDTDGINKIFFIGHSTGPAIFVQLKGSDLNQLFFRVNTQFDSAVQTRDYELGQGATGGTDYECVRGTFYDIQVLCEENLVGDEDTGRIRMWVKLSSEDDSGWVLVADSNIEVPTYDAGAFDGLVFWDVGQDQYFNFEQRWNPTYGGGTGTVENDQEMQIDYIKISVGDVGEEIGQPNPTLDAFGFGSAIGTSCSFVHGGNTPGGAYVAVMLPLTGASGMISSVKYGTQEMTRIGQSRKTSGEPMSVYLYELRGSVPVGVQTVTIVTTTPAVISAVSFTISTDTGLRARALTVDQTINSDSQATPLVALNLTGELCYCGIAFVSGQDSPASVTPLTDWTARLNNSVGTAVAGFFTYDITDDVNVGAGFVQAADDAVAVAFAIGQVAEVPGKKFWRRRRVYNRWRKD